MIIASLRSAYRLLRRRWRTSLLNIGGLVLGVAVCLLAGLYVGTQLGYDQHHEDADRIVRIHEDQGAYTYDDPWRYMADFPGDAAATVLLRTSGVVRGQTASGTETLRRTESLVYTTPTAFDVFTYPLAQGDPGSALSDPSSIVLSDEAAQTHFPGRNPIGETLTVPDVEDRGTMEFTVTGVMEPLPSALHVRPDYLVPFDNLTDEKGETWRWIYLYVRTQGSTTDQDVVKWLNEERDRRMPQNRHELVAQPLTDIYLNSDLRQEIAPTGTMAYVWAFGIVGVLVLLIACINYVNLTTAQVAERMRGVGLRKTFGASRRQVASHFLAESLLVTALAVMGGVVLASLAVPSFNAFAPDPVALDRLWSGTGLGLIAGVAVVTAVLASAYPVLALSRLRPIQLFHGQGRNGSGRAMRRGLVITQFAIAIGMMAVTGVVVQQTNYLATKDLGVDREHTLILSTNLLDAPMEERHQQVNEVERRLRQQQGIRATGRMSMRPNLDGMMFTDKLVVPGSDTVNVRPLVGSEGMTRAVGIPLAAGQRLDEVPEGILINRAAAKKLGDAEVGSPIYVKNNYRRLDTLSVIAGVLEDFHFASLRSEIVPTYFRVDDDWRIDNNLIVRSKPGQAVDVLSRARAMWEEVMPAGTFDYTFMDEEFAQIHRADTQQRNLLLLLAGITLLVACLGLIGLVAYISDRRQAEIGIRKTLGASVLSIIILLSKEILVGLGIAFVVAVPLAYSIGASWLESFAYRIELGPAVFIASGMLVALVALAATASQAYRAAQIDPAVAVREE